MNLTEKQRAELWGEDGPYSEVKLFFESRILDDAVTRSFVTVEANINPFTYRTIKKNKEDFSNDQMVQELMDKAWYQGRENGYLTFSFRSQLLPNDEDAIIKEAEKKLEETKKALIRMHKYVMKMIEGPAISLRVK